MRYTEPQTIVQGREALGNLEGDNPDRFFSFSESPAQRTILAAGEAGKPSIVVMPNGDIVLSYIKGYNLANNPPVGERMEIIISSDGGATWSAPVRATQSPHNDREGYLTLMPDGSLVLGYMRVMAHVDPAHPWQGPFLCRSTDGGRTWSEPWQVDISRFCPAGPFGCADRGHIVLPDGRFLFFVGTYEKPRRPKDYVLVSWDMGRTFPEHHQVSEIAGDSSFTLHPSGKLVGALRINGDDYPFPGAHSELAGREEAVHFLGLVESLDQGKTWSAPSVVTQYNEIPGHITTLHDGRLLLAFGVRHHPLSIQAMVSDRTGTRWNTGGRLLLAWTGERFRLADGRYRHAIGHPYTVQLPDGRLLTAYYRLADPSDGASCQVEALFWNLPEG
ncbi:MAG: exo-alpha-sialidase [Planctomycetes bacterium]|nr:exo-alpha-sialidase [Planctomycetota bacterium]